MVFNFPKMIVISKKRKVPANPNPIVHQYFKTDFIRNLSPILQLTASELEMVSLNQISLCGVRSQPVQSRHIVRDFSAQSD